MLSRRYFAAAVLAAGLATAAVPAVAATPSTTTSPTAAPSQTSPPSAGSVPAKVVKLPSGQVCVISVDKSGRGVIAIKPGTKTGGADAAVCRKLLAAKGQLPFPKGAPQTGGGGMAAEVSSWG